MDHIDNDERISAYLDGELSAEEQSRFEERLAESAELRQLVEELRALRGSLDLLPRHRLEADFAERVLRRAEKEMLLSGGGSSGTGGADNAADDRPVLAARTDVARVPAAGGFANLRRRAARPLVYIAAAIAAAVMIVVFTPPKGDDVVVVGDRGKSSTTTLAQISAAQGEKRGETKGEGLASDAGSIKKAAESRQSEKDVRDETKRRGDIAARNQAAQDPRGSGREQSQNQPKDRMTGHVADDLAHKNLAAREPQGGEAEAASGLVRPIAPSDADNSGLAGGGAGGRPHAEDESKDRALRQSNGQPRYANSRAGGVGLGQGTDDKEALFRKSQVDALSQQTASAKENLRENLASLGGMIVVETFTSHEAVEHSFTPLLYRNGIVWRETSDEPAVVKSFDDKEIRFFPFNKDQSMPAPSAPPSASSGVPAPAGPATPALLKEAGGKSNQIAREKQKDSDRAAGNELAQEKLSEVEVVVVEGTPRQIHSLLADLKAEPAFQSASIAVAGTKPESFEYRLPEGGKDASPAPLPYGALAADKSPDGSIRPRDLADHVTKDEPPSEGSLESLPVRRAPLAKRSAEGDEKPGKDQSDADKLADYRSKVEAARPPAGDRDRGSLDKADDAKQGNLRTHEINGDDSKLGAKPESTKSETNKDGDRAAEFVRKTVTKATRGAPTEPKPAEHSNADKEARETRFDDLGAPASRAPAPTPTAPAPVATQSADPSPKMPLPEKPRLGTPDKGDLKGLDSNLEKSTPPKPAENGSAIGKSEESPADQPAERPTGDAKGSKGGRGPVPAEPSPGEKQTPANTTGSRSFFEQSANRPGADRPDAKKDNPTADDYSGARSAHFGGFAPPEKKPVDGRYKASGDEGRAEGKREDAKPPLGFAVRMRPVRPETLQLREDGEKASAAQAIAPTSPAGGAGRGGAGRGVAAPKEDPSAPSPLGERTAPGAKLSLPALDGASEEHESAVKVKTETAKAPSPRMQAIFFFRIAPPQAAAQAAGALPTEPAATVGNPAAGASAPATSASQPAVPTPAPVDKK